MAEGIISSYFGGTDNGGGTLPESIILREIFSFFPIFLLQYMLILIYLKMLGAA